MEATVLLGDYARASDGKLDVLGAGWTYTGPAPATFGIGILSHVPWDQANVKHRFTLDLLDADGQPVTPQDSDEPLLHAEGEFEVGRPPGMRLGTTQNGAVALNVAGIPIPPGARYQLRLVIDGDEDNAVCVGFETRPGGPQALAA